MEFHYRKASFKAEAVPSQGRLILHNDGPRILKTNYWDSIYACHGKVFLSWNAGTGRLMLPDSLLTCLGDLKTANAVIVSRGPWPQARKAEALEILFEDGTNDPFCFHIGSEMTDRLPPPSDDHRDINFTVWSRRGEEISLPGKFRIVPFIPYLKPWVEL